MLKKFKLINGISIIMIVIIASVIYSKAIMVNSTALEKKPIFRVDNEEKKISITVDINWAENEYLYEILDVLKKYDVKATFFIIGKWVNYTTENKEKLIKIKEEGHEIGNHSYIHPSFTKISDTRILEELKKTDEIIYEAVGVIPKVFRFPSGDYNERVLNIVTEKGYKCIQWDCDSVDWKQSGRDIEYERIIKKVKSGSILLFHNNAKYTPGNLDRIISKLTEEGYQFVTVGELVYEEGYYIDENGEQHKNKY